jgi:hypothetical protein
MDSTDGKRARRFERKDAALGGLELGIDRGADSHDGKQNQEGDDEAATKHSPVFWRQRRGNPSGMWFRRYAASTLLSGYKG